VEQFFSLYDFPVLLAAEWGHVDRLLHVLNRPDTPVSRQRLILTLLGETRVARGYTVLVEKLQDVHVAREAAEALGFFGIRAQPHLLHVVQDRSNPQLQAAAAKGLGRIAAATGNSQQTPLYLNMVADSTIDIRVRTQLVWALGKAPDMRAYPTLLQLEKDIWANYSRDPHLQEFREAVDWSVREVKQGGHGDDF
jgi:HEAT repeat protein